MPVARVHHTTNYTVMSNYHFQDKTLSLKAKGLLSLMLSLPDEWNYSVAGLASLSTDGETAVRTGVQELEEHGYLTRTPIRKYGKISDWRYDIYEQPQPIEEEKLPLENLTLENSALENKDNKVNSNKVKKNKITNSKELVQNPDFQFGKQKFKKENLFTKCTSMINDFTDNIQLQADLKMYLQLLLEMKKDGYTLYANTWKGLLRKLTTLSEDPDEQHKIISQSIERGYKSFFPINSYFGNKYDRKDKPWEAEVTSSSYTKEELEELDRLDREREAQGLRTKF